MRFTRLLSIVLLALGPLSAPGALPGGTDVELGTALGTPGLFNLTVGTWGVSSAPVVLRASGMYFGSSVYGIQGDVGWMFHRAGRLRQFVGASVTSMRIVTSGLDLLKWTGVGPSYGINYYGVSFQIGCSFGSGGVVERGGYAATAHMTSPQLTGQLGFSFFR